MKAIGFKTSLPISDPNSLMDLELPQPVAEGKDLLVRIKAIAVNPVDYKVRQFMPPADGDTKVLGWDAVGEVVATGSAVTQFSPGDTVFYAGDITRQGSNAEYQLVDERIVGLKPRSLSDADAAALPLTSITAWELLFDHLGLQRKDTACEGNKDVLLVTGAAGGVGSILVQLAKTLTHATVIATASRQSSVNWVKKLGADHVVNHNEPLQAQIEALDIGQVTHVASLNGTPGYFKTYTELLVPFGKIALIDDVGDADISLIKSKSLSLHWEFMFARSMHQATDIQTQGDLLNQIAEMVDSGLLQATTGKHLGSITADNLKAAHTELESGTAIGKIVLEGF
ncbi:Zinc-type alcohol dehydrogenase-like protein [BD1-7 clade bacterium]|nr:Zinc-type alcohol dehydrogenase-like protein [BD1-7 clade bacterium]